jgi:hypothetical protein
VVSALSVLVGAPACVGEVVTAEAETGDGVAPRTPLDPPDPRIDEGEAPMVSVAFSESDADLVNPERGFYIGLDLASGDASSIRTDGHSLAIALVRLDAYRDLPLDEALLASLSSGLADVRASGIKVILRFMYNSSFAADASKARILGHIAQLEPVLQANADVIAVMQAGFIGAWGEWHSSTNGLDNDTDRAAILTAILAALPASRAVQVRTPMFKEAIFPGGAVTPDEVSSGSERARVGHHNDCYLASASDMGTYASPIDAWEAYVADDGRYTPIGGETCAVYEPKTSCAPATADMAAKHFSYLNLEYNPSVIEAWDTDGCRPEIDRSLGYRFALQQVSYTEAVAPGGELEVAIDLVNRGYASPFNARPVHVVLTTSAARHVARLANVDARRWAAGEPVTVTGRFRIPADTAPGTYSLSLWLPDDADTLRDDPRYAIQLANPGVWNGATGENLLTAALQVDPAAGGVVDPSAMAFAEIP